jgi:hypothetical protein
MCSGGDELQSLDEGLTNPSLLSRHDRLQKPFPSVGQSRRFLFTAVMQSNLMHELPICNGFSCKTEGRESRDRWENL